MKTVIVFGFLLVLTGFTMLTTDTSTPLGVDSIAGASTLETRIDGVASSSISSSFSLNSLAGVSTLFYDDDYDDDDYEEQEDEWEWEWEDDD
ncbi:hypothetical protein [Candidatus Xianfuyuplasma coldseepsis]|uniref:Uncharacterized protein n=1 Tax=Candidatus Xianfuyuplasma coldseepsis TaxID=2782163 RepID=A0A7L7KSJ9_9MOLU|nr:hypothetical protein [Xianfuyuplasma coldseepsis]QMS85575.1 hypothetical protein G4Z02_07415 [Xianfuyuplasma coldseepsis]